MQTNYNKSRKYYQKNAWNGFMTKSCQRTPKEVENTDLRIWQTPLHGEDTTRIALSMSFSLRDLFQNFSLKTLMFTRGADVWYENSRVVVLLFNISLSQAFTLCFSIALWSFEGVFMGFTKCFRIKLNKWCCVIEQFVPLKLLN